MVYTKPKLSPLTCALAETVLQGMWQYSGTSDSGASEIGTVYNEALYKGHCLRSQIYIFSSYSFDTFIPPEKTTTSLQRTKQVN